VPYLFDTDAISESMRSRPNDAYARWLSRVPREDQYTSSVVVGELYKGAYRSERMDDLLQRIERDVLPRLTVLPYEVEDAKVYGALRAELEAAGNLPGELDLLIGAAALRHRLKLVTGNIEHFRRIRGIELEPALANSRARREERTG
jgi:predicted nucleic acid-binding protein